MNFTLSCCLPVVVVTFCTPIISAVLVDVVVSAVCIILFILEGVAFDDRCVVYTGVVGGLDDRIGSTVLVVVSSTVVYAVGVFNGELDCSGLVPLLLTVAGTLTFVLFSSTTIGTVRPDISSYLVDVLDQAKQY